MNSVLIRTDSRYPVNRKIIRRAVADTLGKNIPSISDSRAGLSDCEVSVSVVGKRKISEIAQKYLNDGELHEVLSFPFEDAAAAGGVGFVKAPDGILRLGDIVLCWPQVLLAAARDGVMVDDEVYLLTAHSVLHLLGKHHD